MPPCDPRDPSAIPPPDSQPYLKLAPFDPVRVGGIDLSRRQSVLGDQELPALAHHPKKASPSMGNGRCRWDEVGPRRFDARNTRDGCRRSRRFAPHRRPGGRAPPKNLVVAGHRICSRARPGEIGVDPAWQPPRWPWMLSAAPGNPRQETRETARWPAPLPRGIGRREAGAEGSTNHRNRY